jgi:cyclic pyranopterin phosphate synthase
VNGVASCADLYFESRFANGSLGSMPVCNPENGTLTRIVTEWTFTSDYAIEGRAVMARTGNNESGIAVVPDQSVSGTPILDKFARPIRDLRISVTDKCNFRCPYCMPADRYGDDYSFLTRRDLLAFEEIARVARVFVQLGACKLRVTGGEPLLRKDLPVLVEMLSAIDGVDDLALTTNGSLLKDHAKALRRAGLHRVTVSLDSLDEAVFRKMSGQNGGPAAVLDGIAAATEAGLRPIKINVVVKRGINDHTVVDVAERFRGTGHVVRFIEYMDVGNCNDWRREDVVPSSEVLERVSARYPLEAVHANYPGEVAERYRYADGAGEVGFISSVSAPFCGSCSRARLSADGRLFLCLFAGDGVDLRGPLREGATESDMADLVRQVWRSRDDRYSELRSAGATSSHKVEMYHIGG